MLLFFFANAFLALILAVVLVSLLRFNGYLNRIVAFQTNVFGNAPEYNDPLWLPITGNIPTWLNGIMYRVGPGRFVLDNGLAIKHAFDGMPFVHRFQFDANRQQVRYNSKHVAKTAEKNLVNGKATILFGHLAAMSPWRRVVAFFRRAWTLLAFGVDLSDPSGQMIGVTATPNYPLPPNIKNLATQPVLVTKTDANMLQKIHADTLEPEHLFRYDSYDQVLKGELAAAHHQHDLETNETFNFTLSFGLKPALTVFSCDANGKVIVLAKITHRANGTRIRPSYIHSFWLTRNYVVLPESPLYFGQDGLSMMFSGTVTSGLVWDPQERTYLHVIARRSGVGLVASIPVDPFYTFHVGNAYEKGTPSEPVLILDCAAFPDGDIAHQVHNYGHHLARAAPGAYKNPAQGVEESHGFYLPPTQQPSFGDLRRISLDIGAMSAKMESIMPNIEFLRFNAQKSLQPYRYVFGNQLMQATPTKSSRYSLAKVDVETHEITRYDHPDQICSEPIFVPRPGASDEDDGVVLSLVNVTHDAGPHRCYILVLDAVSMNEIAKCPIGQFPAITFHGSFVNQHYESVSVN
ncbi:carotenoid oxygenase [Gongronella butleri]|nr:carotenoid oxygenase [Gongronella butleri]